MQAQNIAFISIGAMGSITLLVLGYKYFLNPYLKRRDYERNEHFARLIHESEQKNLKR